MEKVTVNFASPQLARAVFADREENLALLQKIFGVQAVARDNFIRLSGPQEAVEKARKVIEEIVRIIDGGRSLTTEEYKRVLDLAARDDPADLHNVFGDRIEVPSRRGAVRPQTINQKKYVDAIRTHDVVVATGPAGTGKSYLAVAMAVSALGRGEVRRIILTRPARETGEKLGFLPGDLCEKLLPYLRPLYDALYDMMDVERIRKYEEQGVIEVAPLAFMRGRTLNNAFIILDEAQNTTPEQMKMFLTRIGFNSKTVITGDITQIDFPRDKSSGLVQIIDVLSSVKGMEFVRMTEKDVVRHEIVRRIVRAYGKAEGNNS